MTALRFANDGYIRGRNSSGTDELCLYPRTFGNTTILKYGAAGLQIKNNSDATALDINHDLTIDASNNIRIFKQNAQLWLAATTHSDSCHIYFRTSSTTGMKSAIKSHGLSSNGKAQLGFLVSNDAGASVNAVDADVSMLISHKQIGINLGLGNEPEAEFDIRDGDIAFSRVVPTTTATGCRWYGQGQSGNFPSSGRYEFARIESYPQWQGGNLRFFTKAYNSTALSQRMIIAENGNVGIATGNNPTSTLQVGGSFSASSKAFSIDHPLKEGWTLKHHCVETNSCGGLMYKYQVSCVEGSNNFDIPDYVNAIGTDLVCFCSPYKVHGTA